MRNQNLLSPFKVGQEVIHWQGSFRPEFCIARIVTVTGETATQYKAGKLVFNKVTYNDPSGRGTTRGTLKAITPELLEVVERTLADENKEVERLQGERDCQQSDEAEYAEWIETAEGKAMELLQSHWIGAKIVVKEYRNRSGRNSVFYLIGVGGRELASIRINQEPKEVTGRNAPLDEVEVSFSSFRANPSQTLRFHEMLTEATNRAEIWNLDAGKVWDRDAEIVLEPSIAIEK